MPLVETLTLLASLGSAVQALRAGRGPEDKPGTRDTASTGLLLGYEFVKTSQDWAVRANDVLTGRMLTVLVAAGILTAAVPGLVVGLGGGSHATSPLIIAALALVGIMALVAALGQRQDSLALTSPQEVLLRQANCQEWEFLHEMLAGANRNDRHNREAIKTKGYMLTFMSICFAIQASLLAAWALSI